MNWICQLKDGYMLAQVNKTTYRVIHTGYPYPDTKYTAQVAIPMMLDDLDIKLNGELSVRTMQILMEPYLSGVDISVQEMKQIITHQTLTKACIFFKTKEIIVYYIKNLKYNHCVKKVFTESYFDDNDDGFLFTNPSDDIFEKSDLIDKGSMPEYKEFDNSLKEMNVEHVGVSFYEKLVSYVEKKDRAMLNDRNIVPVGSRGMRDMSYIILERILDSLHLPSRIGNSGLYWKACMKIFGMNKLMDIDINPYSQYEGNDDRLTLFSYVLLNCKIDKSTEEHLTGLIKSYLAASIWDSRGYTKFVEDYQVREEGVVLFGREELGISRYLKGINFLYTDITDVLTRDLYGKQMKTGAGAVTGKPIEAIKLYNILGNNFTSYENRLFQFFIVYDTIFRDPKKRGMIGKYDKVGDWVSRYLPFYFENYQRRMIMGGLSFTNPTEYAVATMTMDSDSSEFILNGLVVPTLFNRLKLRDFYGRQLTDDEIIFLLVFSLCLSRHSNQRQIGEGVYLVSLGIRYIRKNTKYSSDKVSIRSDMILVLKTFLKMRLLVDAAGMNLSTANDLFCMGARTGSFLGKTLYYDRYIDRLKSNDFVMTVGTDGVSIEFEVRE